ncbi:hypothetical protein LSH36_57g08061 [Paralvinella palmiformis]|uniref:C2 domain-containing protein n=1 Tax=Paralvinella palmiformis TaxID=53620 RepID=A0AAD9K4V5_9ANNE|nr:hypothetical protein LSH36_57g08061 [Paralvinella palmiformis]
MAKNTSLFLRIGEAKNLPVKDLVSGTSDPYCVIKVDNEEIARDLDLCDDALVARIDRENSCAIAVTVPSLCLYTIAVTVPSLRLYHRRDSMIAMTVPSS